MFLILFCALAYQMWSRGHKARGQGQGQGQPFRGQGQECSRPRTKDTSASALQKKKKKKKVFTKIFQAISTKKRFPKTVSSVPQNFYNSKNSAVLENFRGLEASRPRPKT